jgi:hypothetical protein
MWCIEKGHKATKELRKRKDRTSQAAKGPQKPAHVRWVGAGTTHSSHLQDINLNLLRPATHSIRSVDPG